MALTALGCGDEPTSPDNRVALIEKYAGDSATFTYGEEVELSVAVRVTDAQGNPVAGARVAPYRSENDSTTVATLSNADGIAYITGWRPDLAGINHLGVGNGFQYVSFTAIGICPPTRDLAAGDAISGMIDSGDCRSIWGNLERFRLVATTTQALHIDLSGNPGSSIYDFLGMEIFDSRDRTIAWGAREYFLIIAADAYELELLTDSSSSYDLTIRSSDGDFGCRTAWVTRGVITSQALTTPDCIRAEAGTHYVDRFMIIVNPGETLTVDVASSDFDEALELEELVQPWSDTSLRLARREAQPGESARIIHECPVNATFGECLYRMTVTTTMPSVAGTYTLSIQ